MTQGKQSAAATPVLAATFHDGPDSLLLNPHVAPLRWRAERVRAALYPRVAIGVVSGICLTVVAVTSNLGAAVACAGVFITALGVVIGWERVAGMLTEHGHDASAACRMERRRGEFFFRSRDFTGLGTAGTAVRVLIAGVDELHRSPARAWIGTGLPREVHRIVWQALEFLDRTRAARCLVEELADAPESAVHEVAAAVAEIDGALDEVVRHVQGCIVLTRAWETKLRHAELVARTEAALTAMPGRDDARRLTQAAEALPQNVFAYITAARDTVDAGEFPWEQPTSSWPRSVRRAAARCGHGTGALPVSVRSRCTRRGGGER